MKIPSTREIRDSLNTMASLCRVKYGNLDGDVYDEIQRAERIVRSLSEMLRPSESDMIVRAAVCDRIDAIARERGLDVLTAEERACIINEAPDCAGLLQDMRDRVGIEPYIQQLKAWAKLYGPWHLDDSPSTIHWDGEVPDKDAFPAMDAFMDEACAYYDLMLPRKPEMENWGIWLAVEGTPFCP